MRHQNCGNSKPRWMVISLLSKWLMSHFENGAKGATTECPHCLTESRKLHQMRFWSRCFTSGSQWRTTIDFPLHDQFHMWCSLTFDWNQCCCAMLQMPKTFGCFHLGFQALQSRSLCIDQVCRVTCWDELRDRSLCLLLRQALLPDDPNHHTCCSIKSLTVEGHVKTLQCSLTVAIAVEQWKHRVQDSVGGSNAVSHKQPRLRIPWDNPCSRKLMLFMQYLLKKQTKGLTKLCLVQMSPF